MKLLRYLILSLLSLLTCKQELSAQVSIEFNSINSYMFSSKEALNFIALFSGKGPIESIFIGKIYGQDMSPIVEFKTDVFTLQTGGNVIAPSNLSFRELNFLNSDIAEIEQKTGTFPSGDYTLCLWAVCANPDCGGHGAGIGATEQSQCIQIHIENPTPLLLSYPEDNSDIFETRPIYTWIPPGPIASSANLNYSFNLVQINDGQTKQDALAVNRPLIKLDGLGSPMLVHPYDLPALEEGKSYSWQIVAFVGKSYFASSEQWKFRVKKDTINLKLIPKNLSYIEITGQTGNAMYYAVDFLKIKNEVRFKSGTIVLSFKDKSGNSIKINNSNFVIKPGDNRLDLNLKNELKFRHGEVYELNGYLLSGELFTIKFTYIDSTLMPNE
jgi:hypothetical protein